MHLILHIGAPKTGTSAIQSALARNVETLRARGIEYPDFPSLEIARANRITSGNGVPLAKLLGFNAGDQVKTDHLLDEISGAFRTGRDLLYSSEMLSSVEVKKAHAFRDQVASMGYKLKIIVYVRAIADHALSIYHQWIKQLAAPRGSFADYVRNGYSKHSQRRALDLSVEGFGADAIMVRNYDAAKERLVEDFFVEALGLASIDGLTIENAWINRSLTDTELALMRAMNPLFANPNQARFASDSMLYGEPNLAPSNIISLAAMRTIEDLCGPDLDVINARIEGPGITLKSDALTVSDQPEPQLSEAEKALARMIAGIIRMSGVRAVK